jgi:hypothetical protein
MERIEFRAGNRSEAECLERELAAYAPDRSGLSVSVELDSRSATELFALLSAADKCLQANGIGGVRVEVAGRSYLLEPERAS